MGLPKVQKALRASSKLEVVWKNPILNFGTWLLVTPPCTLATLRSYIESFTLHDTYGYVPRFTVTTFHIATVL